MDILSKETLTLLRDENVRKAVEEVAYGDDGASDSRTVTVETDSDSSHSRREPREVIVSRILK